MIQLQGIDILSLQPALKLGKDRHGSTVIFDPLRMSYVPSTPEEVVRQLWIIYFLDIAAVSKKLMSVERAFQHNTMTRRFDLVIFDRTAQPLLLAEFKGPEIKISQSTFDQIARYNMELNVPFSLISNGREHYCFQIDDEKRRFVWQEKLPFSNV